MIKIIKSAWKKWIKIGEFIGNIVGSITLYIFYYTLFLIPGIYFTLLKDKVGKNYNTITYYEDATDINIHTLEEAQDLA